MSQGEYFYSMCFNNGIFNTQKKHSSVILKKWKHTRIKFTWNFFCWYISQNCFWLRYLLGSRKLCLGATGSVTYLRIYLSTHSCYVVDILVTYAELQTLNYAYTKDASSVAPYRVTQFQNYSDVAFIKKPLLLPSIIIQISLTSINYE